MFVDAQVTGGEDIEFPDSSFDVVYGHSVLHHMNLDIATPKIVHVLKAGGVAAFLEPLDHNLLLRAFRMLTPHRRTPTEQPVRLDQMEHMAAQFSRWEHREFYLLSLAAFVWYYGIKSKTLFHATMNLLSPVDDRLCNAVPFLGKLAWVTVVRFVK
jgi:SAM-dependent methyltransferase